MYWSWDFYAPDYGLLHLTVSYCWTLRVFLDYLVNHTILSHRHLFGFKFWWNMIRAILSHRSFAEYWYIHLDSLIIQNLKSQHQKKNWSSCSLLSFFVNCLRMSFSTEHFMWSAILTCYLLNLYYLKNFSFLIGKFGIIFPSKENLNCFSVFGYD